MRLYGRVTDFDERPLDKAVVRVVGRDFAHDAAAAFTDDTGVYQLEIESGTYLAVWICKDYREKMLEYWAWHVPIHHDLELNARVDGLEVYGLNVFWPRQKPTLMVYFRPMSLTRVRAYESGDPDAPGLIDIAPNLDPEDIEVTLDEQPAPLLCVNKVREQTSPDQYMDAYLVHVGADGILETDVYRKISVAVTDKETQERGEASLFWRHTRYRE